MGRALATTFIALVWIACNDTSSSQPNRRVAREAAGEGAAESAGTPAVGEWLETVACEGAQCCDDAVCDACAGNTESPCKLCEDWPPSYAECRQP
jgi:hypothetical protein